MKRIFHLVMAVAAALFMVCGLVTPVSVKAEDNSFHAITTTLYVNSSVDTAEAAKYYPTSIKAEFHEGDKVLKTVTLSAANNWTATYDFGKTITEEQNITSDGKSVTYYWDYPDLKLGSKGYSEIENGIQHMYIGVMYYRRLVKRVYNPNSGEHLFTANTSEVDHLVSLGWKAEGSAWVYPLCGDYAPVYRVYNPNSGEHFYTKNEAEKNHLVSLGWHDENICFQ